MVIMLSFNLSKEGVWGEKQTIPKRINIIGLKSPKRRTYQNHLMTSNWKSYHHARVWCYRLLKCDGIIFKSNLILPIWFPQMTYYINVQYILYVYVAPIRWYSWQKYVVVLCMTFTYCEGQIWHHFWIPQNLWFPIIIKCSIHFIFLSCSNKVLQTTEMWWHCVWPWLKG